jgi:hypothetical protein
MGVACDDCVRPLVVRLRMISIDYLTKRYIAE